MEVVLALITSSTVFINYLGAHATLSDVFSLLLISLQLLQRMMLLLPSNTKASPRPTCSKPSRCSHWAI